MDTIARATLDATIETERTQLATALRRIAGHREALSPKDMIEPLTMVSEQTDALIRRAETVLKVGSPPARPR